jgi:hypothetical protein
MLITKALHVLSLLNGKLGKGILDRMDRMEDKEQTEKIIGGIISLILIFNSLRGFSLPWLVRLFRAWSNLASVTLDSIAHRQNSSPPPNSDFQKDT